MPLRRIAIGVVAIAVVFTLLLAARGRRDATTDGVTPAAGTAAATSSASAGAGGATATPASPTTAATSATAAPVTGPLLAPGDHSFSLDHNGAERSYLLHVPPQAADGAELPVVLNFHGGASTPEDQRTFSGMNAAADRDGYLAVYPRGTGRFRRILTWNAGGCCGQAMDDGADDVGFTRALLDDLAGRARIDHARVYATGMSNGAMFAHRLAAEAADVIAAIAPVAGTTPLPTFAPSRAVPVMHVHSVDDPQAIYAGGLGPSILGSDEARSNHESVEATIARWVAFDGCPADPVAGETVRAPADRSDAGHTATRFTYGPCRDGTEVVHWRLTGAGHVWPGGGRDMPRLLGAPTAVIDVNAEMWAFFRRFALPR